MREIVFDTETTGLRPDEGHRMCEIGCVEMIDRQATGLHFHSYINPGRSMPSKAEAIHGLSDAFLADKPSFHEIAEELIAFIGEAPLIAHNAPFDMAFLNAELAASGRPPISPARAVDTLALAREVHPTGGQHTLDALCLRYDVDRSGRIKHGALLDATLLAQVYVKLADDYGQLQKVYDEGNLDPESLRFATPQKSSFALSTPANSDVRQVFTRNSRTLLTVPEGQEADVKAIPGVQENPSKFPGGRPYYTIDAGADLLPAKEFWKQNILEEYESRSTGFPVSTAKIALSSSALDIPGYPRIGGTLPSAPERPGREAGDIESRQKNFVELTNEVAPLTPRGDANVIPIRPTLLDGTLNGSGQRTAGKGEDVRPRQPESLLPEPDGSKAFLSGGRAKAIVEIAPYLNSISDDKRARIFEEALDNFRADSQSELASHGADALYKARRCMNAEEKEKFRSVIQSDHSLMMLYSKRSAACVAIEKDPRIRVGHDPVWSLEKIGRCARELVPDVVLPDYAVDGGTHSRGAAEDDRDLAHRISPQQRSRERSAEAR